MPSTTTPQPTKSQQRAIEDLGSCGAIATIMAWDERHAIVRVSLCCSLVTDYYVVGPTGKVTDNNR